MFVARQKELESPTFRLGGGRSIQLSYWRIFHFKGDRPSVGERARFSQEASPPALRGTGHLWEALMKSQEQSHRGILFQIEVWNLQESFVYFKIFKPISWGKKPLSAAGD